MNKEYEYSFKSKDIEPFIIYCKSNGYELKSKYEQIRILYKNGGKVMARITKNIYDNDSIEVLNFKDDNLSDSVLKVSRESKDLKITDENREFVDSLLEILDLKESKRLVRKRFVYIKDNVTFEIDEYKEPIMNVIAIEGIKEEVDTVYNELKTVIDENIINE